MDLNNLNVAIALHVAFCSSGVNVMDGGAHLDRNWQLTTLHWDQSGPHKIVGKIQNPSHAHSHANRSPP